MTSAHPPMEHNPHVHAEVLVAQRIIAAQDAVADGPVVPDASPVVVDHDEVTTAPPGSSDAEPSQVTEDLTIPPDMEGGERPSPNSETAEPAGTDSSVSSSPDATSIESSASVIPSPAPSAESPSPPEATTESSTAGGGTGTGTDL